MPESPLIVSKQEIPVVVLVAHLACLWFFLLALIHNPLVSVTHQADDPFCQDLCPAKQQNMIN